MSEDRPPSNPRQERGHIREECTTATPHIVLRDRPVRTRAVRLFRAEAAARADE